MCLHEPATGRPQDIHADDPSLGVPLPPNPPIPDYPDYQVPDPNELIALYDLSIEGEDLHAHASLIMSLSLD